MTAVMQNIGNNIERTAKMGMSASQARFLSLTARKTNVEYEGQQINQQRTTLSNESSNYYSQLASMSVPVPPSTADYTKISYTFVDGTEKNIVTSLIATKDTKDSGVYMLNYVQEIPADNMVVSGTSIITRTGTPGAYIYSFGAIELQNQVPKETVDNLKEEDFADNPDGSMSPTKKTFVDRFAAAGIPYETAVQYSGAEIINKLKVESQYVAMASEKYATDNWMIRYHRNAATGSYEPILYSKKELEDVDYNDKTGASLSGVKMFIYGETIESKEIKNAAAKVEQDASGRYISLFIYDDETHTSGRKYELTTTTESDDAAYNDAMNQYYYNKAQYDKQIQEVNAKIEIIQVQDKNLELKLKQLDTEQNAISTEMDAVKKVISKNVESSFKTFNA